MPRVVKLFPGNAGSTSLVKLHPEFRPVVKAVRRCDTEALLTAYEQVTAGVDPTWAVNAVTEIDGIERRLERIVATGPESLIPQTMLGGRYIVAGWRIRSANLAKNVSGAQFAAFHEHLRKAEGVLSEVTSAEPDNVAAWTLRLTAARGLQFGLDEARRRYSMAAKAYPNPLPAQRSLIQQLCPKWGGTFEQVHQFARDCMAEAPAGSAAGLLVAEGHIENMFAEQSSKYLRREEVRRELDEADQRSVGHPAFAGGYATRAAYSVFAFVWHMIGDSRRATPYFRELGHRATNYPWTNFPDGSLYRRARRAALDG